MELLILRTKLVLIRWTKNITQLTTACRSCILTPKLYGSLPAGFPTHQFITS